MSEDDQEVTEQADATADAGEVASEDTISVSEHKRIKSQIAKDRDTLKKRLRELEARNSEWEEAQKRGEEDKMRAAEDFAGLEAKLREENELMRKSIAERDRRERFGSLAQNIASKTSQDRMIIEALLLRAEQNGLDVAPEELTPDAVDAAMKAIKPMAEHLFVGKGRGGSPGMPGYNESILPPGEKPMNDRERQVFELAQAMSNPMFGNPLAKQKG